MSNLSLFFVLLFAGILFFCINRWVKNDLIIRRTLNFVIFVSVVIWLLHACGGVK